MRLTRRSTLFGLAAISAGFAPKAFTQTPSLAKVVIIGGGFGGATAATALKSLLPDLKVTLVEPNRDYYACPFSNLVLSGDRPARAQKFSYEALKSLGVNIIHVRAKNIDADNKRVILDDGVSLPYDKVILSPGISFKTSALLGYDRAAQAKMPHAWTGGPETERLRTRLKNMRDGGTVVISVPAAPYRCPPGPYERASLIAHFLKTHKPRSKVLILDAKDSFSKQPLFEKAWREHYPSILEWRGAAQDGRVIGVDAPDGLVNTDFETIKADIANIIPPQKAGAIAEAAGLTDASGWCPVRALDFQSRLKPHIHIIGDATIAAPMPKSAFSAATQARICAIQIVRQWSDLPLEPTILSNTCYSFIDPEQAIAITGVYSNAGDIFSSVEGAGGLTPLDAPASILEAEGRAAHSWFKATTQNAFGGSAS